MKNKKEAKLRGSFLVGFDKWLWFNFCFFLLLDKFLVFIFLSCSFVLVLNPVYCIWTEKKLFEYFFFF